MCAYLYESEAGDRQAALVVLDVCAERYGAGKVKEQCERDKEPIGGGRPWTIYVLRLNLLNYLFVIFERWSLAL